MASRGPRAKFFRPGRLVRLRFEILRRLDGRRPARQCFFAVLRAPFVG
jgi:hypothetical protein